MQVRFLPREPNGYGDHPLFDEFQDFSLDNDGVKG